METKRKEKEGKKRRRTGHTARGGGLDRDGVVTARVINVLDQHVGTRVGIDAVGVVVELRRVTADRNALDVDVGAKMRVHGPPAGGFQRHPEDPERGHRVTRTA